MRRLAGADPATREISAEELESIAGGMGIPIREHLPPHLHWTPAPSPIWAGSSLNVVVPFKLF